ncbi:MAG TPA: response regulator transcription factor, partial [Chthoniobacterales bacterium]|nr:response regulator transcription factor [Chthoniobacterales bacterium]
MKSRKRAHQVKKPLSKPAPEALIQPKPLTVPSNGVAPMPKINRSQPIRILVVDDHPLFRHGLVQLLSSDEGFSVCGESGSAPEALSLIRKLNPNLVIADLSLTGPSGLELTKSIRAEFPRMPVLILSMHDEPTY